LENRFHFLEEFGKFVVLKIFFLSWQVFLQGLYARNGIMNQANDDLGPYYPAGVADHITVELHSASSYNTIIYEAADVPLSTTGTAAVTIPSSYNESYYITIKHRNSLETVSPTAVSFAGSTINRSFGTPADVFGSNLALMVDGGYAIYSGDVNQDGILDAGDMIPVDNMAANFAGGWLVEDVNGDGWINSSDITLIIDNASLFIGVKTP